MRSLYAFFSLFMIIYLCGYQCLDGEGGGGTGKGVALGFCSILLVKFPTLGTGKLFKSDKISLSVFNKTAV